jgi:hypothetical protein
LTGPHPGSTQVMTSTDPDRIEGVWRDESRTPLSELGDAMATSSADGQVDDVTGNDAGAEEAFGEAERTQPTPRPSPDGWIGPH